MNQKKSEDLSGLFKKLDNLAANIYRKKLEIELGQAFIKVEELSFENALLKKSQNKVRRWLKVIMILALIQIVSNIYWVYFQ